MRICPECHQEYDEEVDFCPSDGMKLRSKRTESADPLIGRALDRRWIIEEKLGEGGMGAVYKGHQRSVSRTVAIKTLRPQLVDSEEFVDRFFREAKIAANISHPHCVTILDYGEAEDGTLYLAMEFLDGELLTDRIESGEMTVKEVVEVGLQVASALSAAHEQQIVHRDLKPDNIFLLDVPGGATFAKVLDFGIAKMLDANTQVTKTGMIFGTPEYMSPEQCRGQQIDGRSDLYALGCILYELVGGRTPFGATTPMAVLMAHVNEAAPSLAAGETGAHVPVGLERIIMTLLEKDPNDRYPSAAAVREALEAELQRLENPSAKVTGPRPRATGERQIVGSEVNIGFDETVGVDTGNQGPVEVREPRHTTQPGPVSEEKRSNRGLLALVALLLVAVVAVAGVAVAMLSSSSESDAAKANVEIEADPAAAVANEPPTVAKEVEAPAAPVEAEPESAEDPVETDSEPTELAKSTKDEPEATPEPKRKKKRRRAPKVETKPEPEPEPEPEVAAAPKPTPRPKPTAKPEPVEEPEPEPKPKKKKGLDDKINDSVEKKVKKTGTKIEKGVDRQLDKALDGLGL